MYSRILFSLGTLLFGFLIHDASSSEVKADKSLILTSVIYRHGDRGPIVLYPGDPHTEKAWYRGLEQLTERGIQQEYELGQFLRKRYDGFLSSEYLPDELYVRSTTIDRALMSGESVLAGLYPPEGRQVWNKNMTWQPVPVHTVSLDADSLLRFSNCPKAIQLENDHLLSPEFLEEFESNWKETSDYMREHVPDMKWNGTMLETLQNINIIYDSLFCESQHNMSLPEWVTDKDLMSRHHDYQAFRWKHWFFDQEINRLTGGTLLKKIITDMTLTADPQFEQQHIKMFMYSGHDTTVAMLLSALETEQTFYIPYSGIVMVELYNDTESGLYVEVWFRARKDEGGFEMKKLTVAGCHPSCPLSDFLNFTSGVIPHNLQKECQLHYISLEKVTEVILISLAVGMVLFVILMGISFFACRKKCRRSNKRTSRAYKVLHRELKSEEGMPMMNPVYGSDAEE